VRGSASHNPSRLRTEMRRGYPSARIISVKSVKASEQCVKLCMGAHSLAIGTLWQLTSKLSVRHG
jgi:hypothetical protein